MAQNLVDMLHNRDPITEKDNGILGDPDYTALFKDLQSNILTPHGFSRAHYFVVRFDPSSDHILHIKYLLGMLPRSGFERLMIRTGIEDPDAVRVMSKELQEVAQTWLTGAPGKIDRKMHEFLKDLRVFSEHDVYWRRAPKRWAKQAAHAAKRAAEAKPVPKGSPNASHSFAVNVLLTRAGYAKLAVTPPKSAAFEAGMVKRKDLLLDGGTDQWDSDYREFAKDKDGLDIDALLIVAYDPPENGAVPMPVKVLEHAIRTHAKIIKEEVGNVLRAQKDNGETYVIEPFGFRDSISQPAFYESELRLLRDSGRVGTKWNPFAPLRLALCPDPNGRTPYACGSYFVFRKLEQNIERFYAQSKELSARTGHNEDDIRAHIVGRKPDGSPLVNNDGDNDFDFSDDARGLACPFYSHIRKHNPRSDMREDWAPKERRIVRRGIPYGPPIVRDPCGKPTDGRVVLEHCDGAADSAQQIGLLFLCAQSNIEEQFEYLQAQWVNKQDHPRGKLTAADPLTGQLHKGGLRRIYLDPTRPDKPQDLDAVVHLRGGEYFFAPSISFLRGLLDDHLQH